jgi:hypothetical protein
MITEVTKATVLYHEYLVLHALERTVFLSCSRST